MYTIGIDPGASGAVAILDKDGLVVDVIDIPTRFLMPRKKRAPQSKFLADGVTLRKKRPALKQDTRVVIDAKKLFEILLPYKGLIDFCSLELVNSYSRQGVKSVFTFGERFGVIKGVLESLGINYSLISPVTWQKHFQLTKKGKDKDLHKQEIMELCRTIYPSVQYFGSRGGLKDGRSDALLLANYIFTKKDSASFVGIRPFDNEVCCLTDE